MLRDGVAPGLAELRDGEMELLRLELKTGSLLWLFERSMVLPLLPEPLCQLFRSLGAGAVRVGWVPT